MSPARAALDSAWAEAETWPCSWPPPPVAAHAASEIDEDDALEAVGAGVWLTALYSSAAIGLIVLCVVLWP